jgi:hypothetical protein
LSTTGHQWNHAEKLVVQDWCILGAASGQRRLKLVVEETGSLEALGSRLTSNEGPFEALHLSCHGDIVPERGPVLLLETFAGEPQKVGPGDLAQALGQRKPPLVVLSACRTAERGPAAATGNAAGRREASLGLDHAKLDAGGGTPVSGPELSSPFARRLVTMVPNVVGWDGSVYDRDATEFASTFYEELGKGAAIPYAAAAARQALSRLHAQDAARGRHWHLARVYAGPAGGGAIRAPGKPVRPAAAMPEDLAEAAARSCISSTCCHPVLRRGSHQGHRLHAFGNRAALEGRLRACQQGVARAAVGRTGRSALAGIILHESAN